MIGLFTRLQPHIGAAKARRLCMVLAPLTSLVTTPWQLARTLWNCRVLLDGKVGEYNRFSVHGGLNSLYYFTPADALRLYGRTGTCPTMGLGAYPLSSNFQYSLPSLYAYRSASCMVVLLGMGMWLLSHLAYGDAHGWAFTGMVTLLAGISTTFYANTFALQHYNALSWAWFPLGLFGLVSQQWGLAALAWLGVSLGGPNVAVLAYPLSLVQAVALGSIAPLLALIPVTVKLALHLLPLFHARSLRATLKAVFLLVGFNKSKGQYRRSAHLTFTSRNKYQFAIYVFFLGGLFYTTGHIGIFTITALVLFVINRTRCRVGDDQTFQMLLLSTATMETLALGQFWTIPFYWIAASPLARTANFPSIRGVLDMVPALAPFALKEPLREMEAFLAPVRTGERILMVFNDPDHDFGRIFDGFRVLIELPCFVAQKKGVHCFPDWWAVVETNVESPPTIWGRDVSVASGNAAYWKADYLLIYQVENATLDVEWTRKGYSQAGYFFWGDRSWIPEGNESWNGPAPHWFLLKTPESVLSETNT
ncbi:hypothetical protein [Desulfovibrio sp. JC010]|uniref:hypothetical protein n=1 Tax=Desulfovibrio sp. JC010 TaxID=2593641 RepID=UPI0013CF65D3|nr:hypothetical protein [Desulfovibrio sp. JC010]NDV27493.1 hypothetical protein [Desulfovibrio sp. JC010]